MTSSPEWYQSGVIVLDDIPEPRRIYKVKLSVYAADDTHPLLRNVKITLCCDEEGMGHSI